MTNHRKDLPGATFLQTASRSPVAIAAILCAAAVLGALIGLVTTIGQKELHTARSVIHVQSDGMALEDPLSPSAGSDAGSAEVAFMSGEIAKLSSESMADQIANQQGLGKISYQVSQIGTSDLVSISASDADEQVARKAVSALVAKYQQDRRTSARADLQAQRAEVDRRLRVLGSGPSTQGNSTEIGRLLAVQSSTEYALGRIDRLGAVDTPVYIAKPAGLSRKILLPFLLAVLLTMLAAGVLAFARGTDRILRAPRQLTERGIRVLFPIIALDQPWVREKAVRSLLADLPSGTDTHLLLVDVDGRSGAGLVAQCLRDAGRSAEALLPGQLEGQQGGEREATTLVVARLDHSSLNRTRDVVAQCSALPMVCAGAATTIGEHDD